MEVAHRVCVCVEGLEKSKPILIGIGIETT